MANTTEITARLVLEHREAIKAIKKVAKASDEEFKKKLQAEAKYDRSKRAEVQYQQKRASSGYKDEVNHQNNLIKMRKGQFSLEQVQRDKVKRETARTRREDQHYRRSEERASKRSSGQSGSGLGRANESLGRGVTALAGGLAGFVIGSAISAYQKHIQVEKAKSGSIGMGRGFGGNIKSLSGVGRGFGQELGFNAADSAGHQVQAGRATGYASTREMQQMMRARAMSAGEASGLMSTLTQSGTSFAGGEQGGQSDGGRQVARMMGMAVYSGLKKARFIEFEKGVSSLMKAQGSMLAGNVGEGSALMLAALGKTGLSGFQGERGASMMMKMNQAITNPSAGAAEGRLQRAMGYGPGGDSDYLKSRIQMQKGMGDKDNLNKYLKQLVAELGDTDDAILTAEKELNISAAQSQAILEAHIAGGLDLTKMAVPGGTLANKAGTEMGRDGGNKQLKAAADIFNRMATMGATVAPQMIELQKLQITAVEKLLPPSLAVVKAALKLGTDVEYIVSGLDDIWRQNAEKGKAFSDAKSIDKRLKLAEDGTYRHSVTMDEEIDLLRQQAKNAAFADSATGVTATLNEGAGQLADKGRGRYVALKNFKNLMEARPELGLTRSDVPMGSDGFMQNILKGSYSNQPTGQVWATTLANARERERMSGAGKLETEVAKEIRNALGPLAESITRALSTPPTESANKPRAATGSASKY